MTFEDTIFESLWSYPNLFGFDELDRYRVMDHLFFTVGNGYKWKDGELVEGCTEKRISWRQYLYRALGGRFYFVTTDVMVLEQLSDRQEKGDSALPDDPQQWDILKRKAQEEFLHERATKGDGKVGFYPVCEKYSRIMNVPIDIKPDWLDGAIDFLEFALDSPLDWWRPAYDATVNEQRDMCSATLHQLKKVRAER